MDNNSNLSHNKWNCKYHIVFALKYYDANGNQTSVVAKDSAAGTTKTDTYVYDELNQLTHISGSDGSKSDYTYYATGLRASKNINGSTAVFTYDGTKLLMEQTVGQTKTNIHGTNLIATAGSDVLYYQYNNHGDVISVLDQTGAIKNEYDYDAFGNAITEKETVSNPYRYAGYYQDSESGLYYLQSRYYNPRTARFLTEDTASGKYTDPLSLNKYTYCHNQPVTGYDPDGHFLHIVVGAAIGALVSGGVSYASQAIKNKSFTNVNWKKVAGSAAEGAITGAVGAATGGTSLAASAAGTAAKTAAKTGAKAVAKTVAKKVVANAAANVAGNVANQAISKGVKNINAKEAAAASANVVFDIAGDAAGAALKKAGSKAVSKIAGAMAGGAGATAAAGAGVAAAKRAGAKAAQKTLASSTEAGLAGAGKKSLREKLSDGINTAKALLKDEGGFVDLDALVGKKSLSGTVGKSGSKSNFKVDSYYNMSHDSNVSGQAHHLSQNAAYRDVIPPNDGLCVELEGNAFRDIGSGHYEAHKSMEAFWNQYRRGGDLYGEVPTIGTYNSALYNSLKASGLNNKNAAYAVRRTYGQQMSYGLSNIDLVPRIPGKTGQRK